MRCNFCDSDSQWTTRLTSGRKWNVDAVENTWSDFSAFGQSARIIIYMFAANSSELDRPLPQGPTSKKTNETHHNIK